MRAQHNIPRQALSSLEGFVNREEELRTIEDYLNPQARTWLAVIYGIGGIGKTTFALKIASRAVESRMFDVVVWTTAKVERFDPRKARLVSTSSGFAPFGRKPLASLDQLLKEILKLFAVANKRGWTTEDRLNQVRELLQSRRTLVVVDDFEMLGEGAAEDINEFVGRNLPQPSKALVTSRRELDIPGEARLDLFGLRATEVPELIEQRLSKWKIRPKASLTHKDVEYIHRVTGGNPLAIELLIAQLRNQPIDSLLDSAVRYRNKNQAYQGFEDFLFETAFSSSDRDSQRVWLTLAAIGESRSEEDLSDLTQLPLHVMHEALDWLDANGLINRDDNLVSLHPVAVSYGRRVLATRETLPPEIEMRLEKLLID